MLKFPQLFIVAVRLIALGVLDLVKVVLVELAYKRSKVGVLKVFWQNRLGEFVHILVVIVSGCAHARKAWGGVVIHTLTMKLSPLAPHDTMWLCMPSSSMLSRGGSKVRPAQGRGNGRERT